MTMVYLDRLESDNAPTGAKGDDEDSAPDDMAADPDFQPYGERRRRTEKVPVPDYIESKWARQKFKKAVKTDTLRAARGRLSSHKTRYKNFGFLGSEQCSECGAFFYKGEGIKGKGKEGFLQCCQHGKVFVDPPVIPKEIIDLLDDTNPLHKHFLRNIRTYNHYFAMAAFQGKFARLRNNFPYVVKLHGQIRVLIHHVQIGKNKKVMPSQMQFVDPTEATRSRDAYGPNKDLDDDILDRLDRLLKEHNELVKSFKRMSSLLEKAKKDWSAENNDERPPTMKLVFKRDAKQTTKIRFRPTGGRYEDVLHDQPTPLPNGNSEIAAVFNSNLNPQDCPLWICEQGKPVQLDPRNPLREPLLYPLIYLKGEAQWHYDDPHRKNPTAVANTVTLRQYYSFMLYLRKEQYLQKMLGALTQQWIVEGWVRVEDSDLNFLKKLDYLRVSTRPKLTKILQDLANAEGMDLGKEIKLPMSFSHSPGQMQRHYMNSIQMIRVS
jgi:Helitron helicase-like domain at N-terminus